MADRPCPDCKGTGRIPALPSDAAVRSYMRAAGWQEGEPGKAGTMWTRGDRAIAVAYEMEPGYLDWTSVIERIRWAEGGTVNDVLARINAHQEEVSRG